MRIVMFYHSLVSDWNHGNAHFLRGIASELLARGHDVRVFEPADGWSRTHLVEEHGTEALASFARAYPHLSSLTYEPDIDVSRLLAEADLVLVHEWTDPSLIARIGAYRRSHPHLRLLFHDTHHRALSDTAGLAACDLSSYDGVLAYGDVLRVRYLDKGWARQAWTWHEAADVSVFRPLPRSEREGDLVWIGNWGDGERSDELEEFLIEPVRRLSLEATVYGVRYPPAALEMLRRAGIRFGGWLPNHEVARVFSRFAVTIHVPRRPYAHALPGIPTIRPFEALACGIPLVSAPWDDVEGLFRPGRDFLMATTGDDMTRCLADVLSDPRRAAAMADEGRRTVLARHTCAHRVDELLAIHQALQTPSTVEVSA